MHHVHNLFNGYVQDALPVPQSRAARALFEQERRNKFIFATNDTGSITNKLDL